MTESLAEMLRRTADGAQDPQLNLSDVVAQARKRHRRRQAGAVAGSMALVAAIVIGAVGIWGGQSQNSNPPPVSPSPSPTVVDPGSDGTRPLLFALGSNVLAGDRSVEANSKVMFVDATDDGVVFATDPGGRLWFDDGSTTEPIGRLGAHHVGMYDVSTSNPGSLLVWPDGVEHEGIDSADEFVVYDTSQRQVVARIPFKGMYPVVVHVDAGHVFFNPDNTTPGCWMYDVQDCSNPHLYRLDVASGVTRKITQAEYEAELGTQTRMLKGTEPSNDTQTGFTAHGVEFRQQGRMLIPLGPNGGGDTVLRTPSGEPVQLRMRAKDTGVQDYIKLVQWLDDDRVVLEIAEDGENVGYGDSYRASNVDLVECKLPNGVCRTVVSASKDPYLAPGQ